MSRKSKIDALEKVKIVEQYLNGEISQKGAAKVCGVNKRSVQDWIRIYKTEGPQRIINTENEQEISQRLEAEGCTIPIFLGKVLWMKYVQDSESGSMFSL